MTDLTPRAPRGGALGSLVTLVLVLALVGLGAWLILRDRLREAPPAAPGGSTAAPAPKPPEGKVPEPIEPVTGSPQLAAPAAYEPKDGVVDVELSEYAGYGGLVVANGGLDPSPESFFAKKYGFRVKITVSEEESWSKLNNGRLAASATTADALAVLGRQLEVVVPAQIGFSRGADMVVVDQGITSVNGLAGKVLAGSQFNESEFFVRYLAREAGVPVRVLRDLDARPGPGELGLVFYEDAFAACDAYQAELARGRARLNGCAGWTPRTEEVIEASGGRAKALVTNRNLLVVADVLVVNRGFAEKYPEMAKGLVHGLLEGNRRLRDEQAANLATVARAFQWTEAEARDELAKVHLSNLPENRAFFQGTIDAAGSFGGIFQSSVLAYGQILRNPTDASRFHDPRILEGLQKAGLFADQKIAIAPIRTQASGSLEGDPLLKKDIRFFFEPNSAALDRKAKENVEYLDTVKQFLQVSPGSVVVLRGHVDDARVPEFRKQGGEELVRSMALKAMELSRQRALAVREALLERHKGIDPKRIESVGRGWEEPAGKDSGMNRRVEVQWFTLE
jgi:NitT/TauT family transport system substrate-binding protein